MIEGYYATLPSCPEDHRLNYFLTVLAHAEAHGDLTSDDAMSLLRDYQSAPAPDETPADNLDSSAINLNSLLRVLFDRE